MAWVDLALPDSGFWATTPSVAPGLFVAWAGENIPTVAPGTGIGLVGGAITRIEDLRARFHDPAVAVLNGVPYVAYWSGPDGRTQPTAQWPNGSRPGVFVQRFDGTLLPGEGPDGSLHYFNLPAACATGHVCLRVIGGQLYCAFTQQRTHESGEIAYWAILRRWNGTSWDSLNGPPTNNTDLDGVTPVHGGRFINDLCLTDLNGVPYLVWCEIRKASSPPMNGLDFTAYIEPKVAVWRYGAGAWTMAGFTQPDAPRWCHATTHQGVLTVASIARGTLTVGSTVIHNARQVRLASDGTTLHTAWIDAQPGKPGRLMVDGVAVPITGSVGTFDMCLDNGVPVLVYAEYDEASARRVIRGVRQSGAGLPSSAAVARWPGFTSPLPVVPKDTWTRLHPGGIVRDPQGNVVSNGLWVGAGQSAYTNWHILPALRKFLVWGQYHNRIAEDETAILVGSLTTNDYQLEHHHAGLHGTDIGSCGHCWGCDGVCPDHNLYMHYSKGSNGQLSTGTGSIFQYDPVAHRGEMMMPTIRGENLGNMFETRNTVWGGQAGAYDVFLIFGFDIARVAMYDHQLNEFFAPTLLGDPLPVQWRLGTGCYDTVRHQWYCFGGGSGPAALDSLFVLTYDAPTRTVTVRAVVKPMPPGAWPEARLCGGFAFHQALGVGVLAGGTRADGTYLDDMWTFDGTTMTRLTLTVPEAGFTVGSQNRLLYDPVTHWLICVSYDNWADGTWAADITGSGGGIPPTTLGNLPTVVAFTLTDTPVPPTTTFTLTITQAAGGTIAVTPSGPAYPQGTVVTVTAAPDATHTFQGWIGPVVGGNPGTVTMNADTTVSATYVAVQPPQGAQDWATRSTQPGVLRAIKASAANLQAMKVGPNGEPNFYGYWVSAPWVSSYDTVVYDSALDCFKHVYQGNPPSQDGAYDTYRFAMQFSGPPYCPPVPYRDGEQWPVQFDAAFPSVELGALSANKGLGNEFYLQCRTRYSDRFCQLYPNESAQAAAKQIASATWANGVVTIQTVGPHGFDVNYPYTIVNGAGNYDYFRRGLFVTLVDDHTFTYQLAANPGPWNGQGVIYPSVAGGGKIIIFGTGRTTHKDIGVANDLESVIGRGAAILPPIPDTSLMVLDSYAAQSPSVPLRPHLPHEPFLPNTWYTWWIHVKLGHWYRQHLSGWWAGGDTSRLYAMGSVLGTRTAGPHTITRSLGSWITDGFVVGGKFFAQSDEGAKVYLTVTGVTDLTVTVAETIPLPFSNAVIYPAATLDANGNFTCMIGFSDKDILPGGHAFMPGPWTNVQCADWITGRNYLLAVRTKTDQAHYTVTDYQGNPVVPSDNLQVIGALRFWRDSTLEIDIAGPDGVRRPFARPTSDAYLDYKTGQPGYDFRNDIGTVPCALYPEGLMIGGVHLNHYTNGRAHGIPIEDAWIQYDQFLVSKNDIAVPTGS